MVMKAAFLAVAATLALALISVPSTGALAQGTSAKAKTGKVEYLRAAVDTPAPVAKTKRKKKTAQ